MNDMVRRPVDPWNETTITSANEVGIRQMAGLLELRGQGEDQKAIREAYLDALQIQPGERVLDVGCGTGVVTRTVAQRLGPSGRVVGLDPSPVLLSIGREIAEREGLAQQIEFRVGDVRRLPFDEATFDVVLAITALSHSTDAEQAIPEMLRVVRPGGRIGIFDLDTPSWIITHPDRELTQRVAAAGSMIAVDGMLARRLPGLLEAAGVEDVRLRAYTPMERDPNGFYAQLAERWAGVAMEVGAITEEEHRRWIATLHAEQAANRYVAGMTHLFVWGRRSAR